MDANQPRQLFGRFLGVRLSTKLRSAFTRHPRVSRLASEHAATRAPGLPLPNVTSPPAHIKAV